MQLVPTPWIATAYGLAMTKTCCGLAMTKACCGLDFTCYSSNLVATTFANPEKSAR